MADEKRLGVTHTVVNTVRVKEAGRGGRLYSGLYADDLDNGSFLFLGEYITGEKEIRELLEPTAELIKNDVPMMVMTPEILYDESRKSKQALKLFYNKGGKAVAVQPISNYDDVEFSKEGFTNPNDLAVGKYVVVTAGEVKLTVVDDAPTDDRLFGKITSSRKSHLSTFLAGTGQLFPGAYDIYNVTFTVR